VAAERAEEREAEVRDAEVMQKQSALEAALHDDVTKSAKRNMKALLGASTCVLFASSTRGSMTQRTEWWTGGPAVAWLAPCGCPPAQRQRGFAAARLLTRRWRGWPRTATSLLAYSAMA
jgi:hypothetical protein